MNDHRLYPQMAQAVIDGDREASARLAKEALAEGLPVQDIIARGFLPGLDKVGELWECGDYFLPELIQSAEGMKAALAVLRPALEKNRRRDGRFPRPGRHRHDRGRHP